MSSGPQDKAEVKTGYQTLKGQLYEEGTGTISLLILDAEDGNDYQVTADNQQLIKELRNLKGLPVLLTGKVTAQTGSYQLGTDKAVELYQGQLQLTDYNVAYDLTAEETAVLGRLARGNEQLVVVTKDQYIIELTSISTEALTEQVGKKIVVTGEVEQISDYRYQMKVKGTRTWE